MPVVSSTIARDAARARNRFSATAAFSALTVRFLARLCRAANAAVRQGEGRFAASEAVSRSRPLCYDGAQMLNLIRTALSVLALVGLILAPLARPAMAEVPVAVMTADMAAMPTDMPCCPDEAPVPNCAKDCPLTALCMVGAVLSLPDAVELVTPHGPSSVVRPGIAAHLAGLSHPPPPRPPNS
jgi:hypothetical protein